MIDGETTCVSCFLMMRTGGGYSELVRFLGNSQ